MRGAGRFIALEMAGEVPGGAEIRQRRVLALPLLHAVFAEVAESGVEGVADGIGGERLRYGDEGDLLGAASRAVRGALDPFADALQVFANHFRINAHCSNPIIRCPRSEEHTSE